MEYIDIYNSDGKPLGIKKTRDEIHSQGLWHKTVHVWVVNSKDEILIQKRSPKVENHPNQWDISAAGHIPAGEDDISSALRETEEEIGLKLSPNDLIRIGTIKNMSSQKGYINNEFHSIFVVKINSESVNIKKQEEEVAEVKFIPRKGLQKIVESGDPSFVPHSEEYALLFDYLAD
ncbi:MAG: NUDIX domain-containing protein [Minisyncoccales bacterium]